MWVTHLLTGSITTSASSPNLPSEQLTDVPSSSRIGEAAIPGGAASARWGWGGSCRPVACQRLALDLVELVLGDRAAVEQLLGLGQLRGGPAAATGHGADVVVVLLLARLDVARPALGHPLALGDEVDEHAQERQDDHERRPAGLAPAGHVMAAEQVREYRDQRPDPDHECEKDEHRPNDVQQRIVGPENHLRLLDWK